MEYNQFKSNLELNINKGNKQRELITFINNMIKQEPYKAFSYRKASFSVLKNINKSLAIDIIEPAISNLDTKFLNVVKSNTYDLIKGGEEEKRSVFKKVQLREIELEFHDGIKNKDSAEAIHQLEARLIKHPYLSQTIYKILARQYHTKDTNLYTLLKNKTIKKYN